MAEIDIYSLLSLPRNADDEEIRAAFLREIKRSHPDVAETADVARAQKLIEARAILLDPEQRRTYDASLGGNGLVRQGSKRPSKWIFVCSHGLGEYLRIQDALDIADDGDKIYILPGTYREPLLRIEKRIEVVGQPSENDEVILEPIADGIYIAGDGAIVRSVVINTQVPRSFGIVTTSRHSATISNCRIVAPQSVGIVAADGTALIEGCSFVSCLHGVRVENAHATILGNTFASNNTGVLMRTGSDCVIENNEFIENAAAALEAQDDANVTFSRNRLTSCTAGAVLSGAVNATIDRNRFNSLDEHHAIVSIGSDVIVSALDNQY